MKTQKTNHIQHLTNQITKTLGLIFISDKETETNVCFAYSTELRDDYKTTFLLIDILDYSYAVLKSSPKNEEYNHFLIRNHPQLPYPKNTKTFWELVKLGHQLRQNHLVINRDILQYQKIILALIETDNK